MKVLKPILLTTVIMAVLAGGVIYFLNRSEGPSKELNDRILEDQRDEAEERAYRFDIEKNAVRLATGGEEKNVLNFDSKNVYQVETSNKARERIDRLIKRKTSTFEEPIIAANPFGTNANSFYFYFETKYRGMVRYTVTVEDESISDLVRYINNGQEDNLSREHEFTVSGLVPGMTNYIVMEVLDSTGAKREGITYFYDAPACKSPIKLDIDKGRSKDISTLGLYFTMPKGDEKIYAYDNSGILRNITNTEGAHGSRFYQTGDSVFYQVTDTKVARVSALGRVLGVAEIKGYGPIRDFSYDGYGNIYALVKKKGKDYIVSGSFQSGNTRQVYAFPKGVSPASISEPVGGNLYVAAAKPDGIIKIKALTSNTPKVAFVLGKKSKWKKTPLKKKVIQDKLVAAWETGQAILNLQSGSDGTNDTLSAYVAVRGRKTAVEFVVQGKKKSVLEKNNLPVGEGGVCNSQPYDGHTIIANYSKGTFSEYDKEGKVTKQFSLGKAADGIVKRSLNGMCFYAN